ncbi:MAG: tetratricopeptide repeat protein, partial [Chloroflexi bacterium]|nr:tetratricopeptide repeat protein [Chloroflexota bacterium]
MIDDRLPSNLALLAWCAVLRRFDRDLLRTLAAPAEDDLAALLASATLTPSADGYVLLDEQCAPILDHLRAEQPLAELALHTRAFELFLRRMESADDASREADEARCLHHLSELRDLLIERMDWRTITGYVAAVRAANPAQERTRRWLSFYQGYADIRIHDYDHGDPILLELEQQPDLEPALRIRVLHALGHTNWFQTRYDRALALYRQAHALSRDNGDLFHQGYTLLNMSQIYNDLAQYEQALDLSLRSLELFRTL